MFEIVKEAGEQETDQQHKAHCIANQVPQMHSLEHMPLMPPHHHTLLIPLIWNFRIFGTHSSSLVVTDLVHKQHQLQPHMKMSNHRH
jgi:hypothetical protein